MVLKKLFNKKKEVTIETKETPAIDYSQADFSTFENSVCAEVQPFTMTSRERIVSLIRALEYITANSIEGDIIECGVWKGGSSMSIVKALQNKNINNRELYLYDTFEGMTEPELVDKSFDEIDAKSMLKNEDKKTSIIWAYSELEEVKNNLFSTGYPKEKIHFIKGKVEDTLPLNMHKKIAILRLDTDWYSSTKVELELLFPKLAKGGILIIDDYGHWQGAKKAVDEYFEKNKIPIFLHRIDYTGRMAIKM